MSQRPLKKILSDLSISSLVKLQQHVDQEAKEKKHAVWSKLIRKEIRTKEAIKHSKRTTSQKNKGYILIKGGYHANTIQS